jgi:hypothetical protein
MNKQPIFVVVSLFIVIGIIGIIFLWQPPEQGEKVTSTSTATSTTVVTTTQEVLSKTIYDPTSGLTLGDFQARCEARGGRFNECGSPCGPEAEACILMCVYTCEPAGGSVPKPDAIKSQVEAGIGQTVSVQALSITPQTLLEDSRCPIDVVCIQAGTVRVTTKIVTSAGIESRDLKLSESVVVGNTTLTLLEVSPGPISTKSITPSDYRFTFEITKN